METKWTAGRRRRRSRKRRRKRKNKRFNITNHEENANQNQNAISPHPSKDVFLSERLELSNTGKKAEKMQSLYSV